MTEYVGWKEYSARSRWVSNQTTYGNAFKISRKTLISSLMVLCLVTPGTNWIIPFLSKIIRTGLTFRWA